jgi:hypothetical protein
VSKLVEANCFNITLSQRRISNRLSKQTRKEKDEVKVQELDVRYLYYTKGTSSFNAGWLDKWLKEGYTSFIMRK